MRFIKVFACLLIVYTQVLMAADVRPPDSTIMIPMRDGTQLPTDIYLPKDSLATTPSPCVLMRSPGGKKTDSAVVFTYLTQFGYVVAIQDTRNALDPEGKTMPYWNDGWGEQQDGYDTVEWLAKSPYSNGKIGTVGTSALGITQLLMAPTAPPALKCQYIGMAASSMYHDAAYPGGQLLKNQVEGWLGLHAKDPSLLARVCSQPIYNAFWENFDSAKVVSRVKVPGIIYGGWYDTFLQGTINAYVSRQENGGEGAKGKQKLLIGPWTHFWPLSMKIGDFDIPKQGQLPPVDMSPQRWLDFYLKGIRNGIDAVPNVTYYVMGPLDGSPSSGNVWRSSDRWPIEATDTSFYLTSDRILAEKPVNQGKGLFSYQNDPSNPVPTIGGRNLFLESGAKDQRPIEQRSDMIVFTSAPLTEDLEVTGHVLAKLMFASDKQQADVVVRLCDVYPDGRSILIADGASHVKVTTPDQPQQVSVDLWSTSQVFAKGHSIRVSVSSSNYPRYEKCSNSDAGPVIAKNTLHVGGGDTSSQLILPLVRRGDLLLNKQK